MKKTIAMLLILAGVILTPAPQEQPQEQHTMSYAQEQEEINRIEEEQAQANFDALPEQVKQRTIEEQTETTTEIETEEQAETVIDNTTATATATATATEDTVTIICDKCGQHFETENELYEHDIAIHGYCEEHGRFEDCYNTDGTLKDYYHRF